MTENLYNKIQNKDNNSCTVVALSLAAGMSYDDALHYLAAHGRKRGRGMRDIYWKPAYKKAGVDFIYHDMTRLHRKGISLRKAVSLINQYEHGAFILVRGHIAFVKDGIIHDWLDPNRRHKVRAILEIIPCDYDKEYVKQKIEEGKAKYEKKPKEKKRNRRTTLQVLADKYGYENSQEFQVTGNFWAAVWQFNYKGANYRIAVQSKRDAAKILNEHNGDVLKAAENSGLVNNRRFEEETNTHYIYIYS